MEEPLFFWRAKGTSADMSRNQGSPAAHIVDIRWCRRHFLIEEIAITAVLQNPEEPAPEVFRKLNGGSQPSASICTAQILSVKRGRLNT